MCWNPTPNVMVSEGKVLGKWLGLDEVIRVEPSWKGLVPLKGSLESFLSFSAAHHVRIQQDSSSPQPGRGFSPEPAQAGTLIQTSSVQNVGNKFLLFASHAVYGTSLEQLELTRTAESEDGPFRKLQVSLKSWSTEGIRESGQSESWQLAGSSWYRALGSGLKWALIWELLEIELLEMFQESANVWVFINSFSS